MSIHFIFICSPTNCLSLLLLSYLSPGYSYSLVLFSYPRTQIVSFFALSFSYHCSLPSYSLIYNLMIYRYIAHTLVHLHVHTHLYTHTHTFKFTLHVWEKTADLFFWIWFTELNGFQFHPFPYEGHRWTQLRMFQRTNRNLWVTGPVDPTFSFISFCIPSFEYSLCSSLAYLWSRYFFIKT